MVDSMLSTCLQPFIQTIKSMALRNKISTLTPLIMKCALLQKAVAFLTWFCPNTPLSQVRTRTKQTSPSTVDKSTAQLISFTGLPTWWCHSFSMLWAQTAKKLQFKPHLFQHLTQLHLKTLTKSLKMRNLYKCPMMPIKVFISFSWWIAAEVCLVKIVCK